MDRLKIKTDRAKQHLAELLNELKSFFDTKPYTIGTKNNPQTKQLIYYVSSVKEVPIKISAIAGDVLQNLRSALDHLAYNLVLVGTGNTPSSHIYFPIFNNLTEYQSGKMKKIQGMMQDAINAIDAIGPYKEGNIILWQLHRLNNVDKHRLLITVGSSLRSVDLGTHIQQTWDDNFPHMKVEIPPLFIKPADILFPLKVGDELFVDEPYAKINSKMQFRFDIVFGEVGIIEGESIIETLQKMINEVENVLSNFHTFI